MGKELASRRGIWRGIAANDAGFGSGGLALIAVYLYGVLPRWQGSTAADSTIVVTHLTQSDERVDALLLMRRDWMIIIGGLVALLIVRLLQGHVIGIGLIFCPLLMVLCWGILWFRERKRGDTLLDNHLPMHVLAPSKAILAAVVFIGVGTLAYNLPDVTLGSVTPFTLIGLGFTAYGLAWLPTVSLVLGIQGYLHQLATRKM
ncbi:MAG: hypothetical protein GC179_02300 [Anaerolineaceae bacterium]|nr:hypothetical protein [Anaerolineaceae bacterium]